MASLCVGIRVSWQSLQWQRVEVSLQMCYFAFLFLMHKYGSMFVFPRVCGLCWAASWDMLPAGILQLMALLCCSALPRLCFFGRALFRGLARFDRRPSDVFLATCGRDRDLRWRFPG